MILKPIERVFISSYSSGELVYIKAITSLHPGIGRAGEVADLPVQRDSLGFPTIYSSSIKGAMKSAFWQREQNIARILFGPETMHKLEEKFTSAVAILDCFLLAMPVRSLVGVYAFLTTPLLLRKFTDIIDLAKAVNVKDLDELDKSISGILDAFKNKATTSDKALVSSDDKLRVNALGGKIIINEEIQLTPERNLSVNELEKALELEEGRLIVVNDDCGLHAVNRSLVRSTRIKLEKEEKKYVEGALWTEESIPQKSIFYTLFLYSKPTWNGDIKSVEDVKKKVRELLRKSGDYLIIGGHETIGRGIIKLKIWGEQDEP